MIKAATKTLLAATVGAATLSLAISTKPAEAATLTYNFTVNITRGFCTIESSVSLGDSCGSSSGTYVSAGSVFQGTASYDDSLLTRQGLERLDPRATGGIYVTSDGTRLTPGKLQIQFDFLGKKYSEADDFLYIDPKTEVSGFPKLSFRDGKFLGLDFLVNPQIGSSPNDSIGFQIFQDQFFVGSKATLNSDNNIATLTGVEVGKVIPPAAVPEPSGVGGLLVVGGLVGLRMWRTRHQSKINLSNHPATNGSDDDDDA